VGQELAALLFGILSGSMAVTASFALQDKYYGFFIHDDFKVSKRLTLNLGLRYELEAPMTERFDRLVGGFAFDESAIHLALCRRDSAGGRASAAPIQRP
jgi:hypothetical protein